MKKRYKIPIIVITVIAVILLLGISKNANDKKKSNEEYIHAYNLCEITLNSRKYSEASDCFYELLQKYNKSEIRYNYALALSKNKDYERAKKELEYIIDNEKKQIEIVQKSKDLADYIDDKLLKLRKQTKDYNDVKNNNLDVGDYYSELGKDIAHWENPTNITVYIEDDPKKYLYEKAFTKWNGALGGIVYFKFVDNSKNANIICSFVEQTQGTEGGATDWHYIEKNGIQYFIDSKIAVTKRSPHNGQKLNDNQIYSIILHEIGHALGISGHSNFKGDIMYFSTENYLNEKGLISQRDINTVKKIYKK